MRTFTPSATRMSTVSLPEDLVDYRSAASVNTSLEALANGLKWANPSSTINRSMAARNANGVAFDAGLSTIPVTGFVKQDDTNIRFATDPYITFRTINAGAAASMVSFSLRDVHGVYDGATITSVTFYLRGAGGHGALPTMPRMAVYRTYNFGAPASVHLLSTGWLLDSSANVAAYEAAHSIVYVPDQNNTVADSYEYTAYFQNESGAAAVLGAELYSIQVGLTLNGIT